jgi:hypothetical protein
MGVYLMTNKFIGEVDASEFGAGHTIRLDMDGQARLETEFGEFEFIGKVQLGLAVLSAKYLKAFLSVALRDADGKVVKAFEMPDVPLEQIGKKCLDALALFRYGKDHETWAKEAQAVKPGTSENPTKGMKA